MASLSTRARLAAGSFGLPGGGAPLDRRSGMMKFTSSMVLYKTLYWLVTGNIYECTSYIINMADIRNSGSHGIGPDMDPVSM